MSGIAVAAASGKTVVAAPLSAGILFAGGTSNVHYNVSNDEGDLYTDLGVEFDLSYGGGVGAVTVSYDVTASSGHGYCSNPAHTLYGQGGTTITTAQIMSMAWGINFTAINIGDNASITVRCKAVDSLGTIAYSGTIAVSITRTS